MHTWLYLQQHGIQPHRLVVGAEEEEKRVTMDYCVHVNERKEFEEHDGARVKVWIFVKVVHDLSNFRKQVCFSVGH